MAQKVHVVDIVRHGTQFVIPEGMSLMDGARALVKRSEYEEQETEIIEEVRTFVWDGALALQKAIAQMFGWADAQTIPGGFFEGEKKPKMIQIETGVNETTLVPFGVFKLPGIEGTIETGMGEKNGMKIFSVKAVIKRKYTDKIRELIELTRKFVKEESIYRGKAIKIRFRDLHGSHESMPQPEFLDTSRTKPEEIVFSEEVQKAVEGNLLTPIRHKETCRRHGVPLKRGVLLYGPYGTGKTLVANATAKVCTENGWTFLMCERADEIKDMVSFAHQYQPAVIFCEDIDRAVSGERTVEMDDILNIIDGIESKNTELMVVLTTNHVENINKAMLRPGRLDAVIHVLPPDSPAVQKLVRLYGRGLVPENADLTLVGEKLNGMIPAVVRECVERAKLFAISSGALNGKKVVINSEHLLDSAITMRNQLDLLNAEVRKDNTEVRLGKELGALISEKLEPVADTIQNIRDAQDD